MGEQGRGKTLAWEWGDQTTRDTAGAGKIMSGKKIGGKKKKDIGVRGSWRPGVAQFLTCDAVSTLVIGDAWRAPA